MCVAVAVSCGFALLSTGTELDTLNKPKIYGDYQGFSLAVGNPEIKSAGLEITSSVNRRFRARLLESSSETGEPIQSSVDGTVSASGNVSAQARSADGDGHAVIDGNLVNSNGASILGLDTRTIHEVDDRPVERSVLMVIRSFAFDSANPPADTRGAYEGSAVSLIDGHAIPWHLTSSEQEGSTILGGLIFGDENAFIIQELRGTLNANGDFVAVTLGREPSGNVVSAKLIGAFNPQPDPPGSSPRIEGSYEIRVISTEDNGSGDTDTFQDVGTFSVEFVNEDPVHK